MPASVLLTEFAEFATTRGHLSVDDMEKLLSLLPAEERRKVTEAAFDATAHLQWVPNTGPQYRAARSEADEVGYGGEAGGGKSDLIMGLAVTEHNRSLILRRTNVEARKLVTRMEELLGTRDGWNGETWRLKGGRLCDIGGCQLEEDKQKYKGNPHDLICFDQLEDFSKSQYEFIIGWNRSTDPSVRCRIVNTFNPPTTSEGMWVLDRYAAWLDPRHPNPAEDGELRWYTRGEDGSDMEVNGQGPHLIGGEQIMAKSRTFIRAHLSDNPDLAATNYGATLAALPSEYRDAYKSGNFESSLKDRPFQVVPLSWIREAQQRWSPRPPPGIPMCAIGVDASGGGSDPMVLAIRHDGWFAPMIEVPAKDIPQDRAGAHCAGIVISRRRDLSAVIVDMGGGYGGSIFERLKENGVEVRSFKGSEKSMRRTNDKQMSFKNLRTEAYWKFREALDPDQPGGSPIALPDDRHLVADLTAPSFEAPGKVIELEPKDDVVKRLGRSPDRGDAVVMAWWHGPTYVTDGDAWRNRRAEQGWGRGFGGRPVVRMSPRQEARARRG